MMDSLYIYTVDKILFGVNSTLMSPFTSRKHTYIILTPFYIAKLGFTGVFIIFLISAQKHRLWYSLEPPRRGGSNEYPQSMF